MAPSWFRPAPALLLALLSHVAAQSIALPNYLTNMERQNSMPVEPIQTPAEAHGFQCLDMRLFTYQNATSATTAVNTWVQQNGLQTQTVSTEAGLTQWKATNGNADLYAIWEATEQGGRLWMCNGTDTTAEAGRATQRATQVQQAQATQTAQVYEPPQETHSSMHIRIPLWAIGLLGGGLASVISRSIARNPFDPSNDHED